MLENVLVPHLHSLGTVNKFSDFDHLRPILRERNDHNTLVPPLFITALQLPFHPRMHNNHVLCLILEYGPGAHSKLAEYREYLSRMLCKLMCVSDWHP
jgi:hypothetical protein